MDNQECRKLFEEVYVKNKQAARRNEHGDYVLPSIQDAWSGWFWCYIHLTSCNEIELPSFVTVSQVPSSKHADGYNDCLKETTQMLVSQGYRVAGEK